MASWTCSSWTVRSAGAHLDSRLPKTSAAVWCCPFRGTPWRRSGWCRRATPRRCESFQRCSTLETVHRWRYWRTRRPTQFLSLSQHFLRHFRAVVRNCRACPHLCFLAQTQTLVFVVSFHFFDQICLIQMIQMQNYLPLSFSQVSQPTRIYQTHLNFFLMCRAFLWCGRM